MNKIALHIIILALSLLSVLAAFLACYAAKWVVALGFLPLSAFTLRYTYHAMQGNESEPWFTNLSLCLLFAAAGFLV